jgi:competence protein ComEC
MASLVVVAVSVVLVARPAPGLQLTVLDVGQGDAILLESHGQRLLVDGGPDPDLLVRRLDERIPVWDRHIELVLLTHPHEDHSGGLAGLVPRYRLGSMAETGMASDGAGVRELRVMASRHDIRRARLTQGDRFSLGQVRIDVLWPPREAVPSKSLSDGRAVNGTSIVLAVRLGRQRIMLTGDLEDDHDADILKALSRDGERWDLLKVAHHGSATASSAELLEALRPRLAVISSGRGNRYGHPAGDTLDRLAAVGARVWRTDSQGTISVSFDGRPRPADELLAGPGHRSACGSAPGPPALPAAADDDPCYARPDGGTHPNRSTVAAPVYVAQAAAAAAHGGGRRGSFVPGLSRRARRHRGGPTSGGDSRAPPRHRQGAAARAPRARPRAR